MVRWVWGHTEISVLNLVVYSNIEKSLTQRRKPCCSLSLSLSPPPSHTHKVSLCVDLAILEHTYTFPLTSLAPLYLKTTHIIHKRMQESNQECSQRHGMQALSHGHRWHCKVSALNCLPTTKPSGVARTFNPSISRWRQMKLRPDWF